jgi:hypothetical protein
VHIADGALGNVGEIHDDIVLCNSSGQLEITVSDGSVWVVVGDKVELYFVWEGLLPNIRLILW